MPALVAAIHVLKSSSWSGLILDVTEEQIVADLPLVRSIAKRLANCNSKLAMDDFGSGKLSLAKLHELPFAELKLDRAFVANCGTEKSNAAVCKTVVDLAHNFGSVAGAIGVEKAADVYVLQALGCDLGRAFCSASQCPRSISRRSCANVPRRRCVGRRARSLSGRPDRPVIWGAPAAFWAEPRCLMRPGGAAAVAEIVGVGDDAAGRFFWLEHLIRNTVALAIGDRFLLRVKAQVQLLLHVGGTGPAHQRLDEARLL